jgi:hypothetical protein
MNRLRVCLLLFAFTVAVAARAEQTNAPSTASVTSNAAPSGATSNALPTSITIDGIIYSNVTWRTATAATVTIFHSTGIAAVPLWKLPPELQKRFGYDQKNAAAYLSAEQMAHEHQEQQRQQQTQERQMQEQCKDTISGNVQAVVNGGIVINHRVFIQALIQAGINDPRTPPDYYTFLACDNSGYAMNYEVKCLAYRDGFADIQPFGKIERWVYCRPWQPSTP